MFFKGYKDTGVYHCEVQWVCNHCPHLIIQDGFIPFCTKLERSVPTVLNKKVNQYFIDLPVECDLKRLFLIREIVGAGAVEVWGPTRYRDFIRHLETLHGEGTEFHTRPDLFDLVDDQPVNTIREKVTIDSTDHTDVLELLTPLSWEDTVKCMDSVRRVLLLKDRKTPGKPNWEGEIL